MCIVLCVSEWYDDCHDDIITLCILVCLWCILALVITEATGGEEGASRCRFSLFA